MKKVFLSMMVILGLSSLLGGCAVNPLKLMQQKTTKTEKVEEDDEDEWTDKYNAYVSLRSYLTREFDESEAEYIDNHADESGDFVQDVALVQNLPIAEKIADDPIKNAERYLKKKPNMKIDKAAAKLLSAVKKERDILNEMSSYYETNGYEKDNYKKGKALDDDFTEQFGIKEIWFDLFEKGLDKLEDESDEKDLTNFKDNKDYFSLAALESSRTAEKIRGIAEKIDDKAEQKSIDLYDETVSVASLEKIIKVDWQAFDDNYQEIQKYLEKLAKINDEQLEKENISRAEAEDFMAALTEYNNVVAQLKSVAQSNPITSELGDALNEVYDAYNDLIEAYSQLM